MGAASKDRKLVVELACALQVSALIKAFHGARDGGREAGYRQTLSQIYLTKAAPTEDARLCPVRSCSCNGRRPHTHWSLPDLHSRHAW